MENLKGKKIVSPLPHNAEHTSTIYLATIKWLFCRYITLNPFNYSLKTCFNIRLYALVEKPMV